MHSKPITISVHAVCFKFTHFSKLVTTLTCLFRLFITTVILSTGICKNENFIMHSLHIARQQEEKPFSYKYILNFFLIKHKTVHFKKVTNILSSYLKSCLFATRLTVMQMDINPFSTKKINHMKIIYVQNQHQKAKKVMFWSVQKISIG